MNLDNVKPYFKFINFAELGDFNAFQDEMYALKNKSIPLFDLSYNNLEWQECVEILKIKKNETILNFNIKEINKNKSFKV